MGRAPCCDKANVKKGPWSPDEDAKLKAYIEHHGTGGNWISLPQKIGLKRCGKSCRLRWLNYLRPNIKHGGFSEEEDNIICSLYISIGSRWSIIAAQLQGRTDNDIKNYWNTRLKKKLLGKQRKEQQARRASGLKQEMKRETNSMVSELPYWPQQPIAVPIANPNHNSSNFQYPFELSSTQSLYENSITMNNTACSQLPNTHYVINDAAAGVVPNMFQEFNNFPIELDGIVYSTPRQLDGLESFSGVDMVNGSTGTSSAESTSWGDVSSLVYPPTVSNYQQGMLQDCVFEEPSYFGLQ